MKISQKRAIWYSYRENAISRIKIIININNLIYEWGDFYNKNRKKYIRYKNCLNVFCKLHNLPIITI